MRRGIVLVSLLAAGGAPAATLPLAVERALRIPVRWTEMRPGLDTAEVALTGRGPLGSLRLVVVRLDPARLRLRLVESYRDAHTRGAWTTDSMPCSAVFAANAGQFRGGAPWGWLVRDGVQRQQKGSGSLAMDVVLDAAGGAWLLKSERAAGAVPTPREAFQSYPMLLGHARVPEPLLASGRGVDLAHRDSRLALGRTRDGRLLFVLTRYTALGQVGERLPLGPTVPEMAQILLRLGAYDAVLLDGGISSQMVVRDAAGRVTAWGNWRPVPLALVAEPVR